MAQQPEKNSDEKYPRTLILNSAPELSTPTESRHNTCLLEGKSPSVKLMSRRENKELAKTNRKNMGRFLHGSDTNHQLDTWTLALKEPLVLKVYNQVKV